jgi:hypothetical protein
MNRLYLHTRCAELFGAAVEIADWRSARNLILKPGYQKYVPQEKGSAGFIPKMRDTVMKFTIE